LQVYRAPGPYFSPGVGASLVEAVAVFGLALIATFASGFVLGVNWFKLRALSDLFL
jgi:hypothetical protein